MSCPCLQNTGRHDYPAFMFRDMFLDATELFLLHVTADREGNWQLHLHSCSSMLPYYAFGNKVNYIRWTPIYILDMLQLPKSAKDAFEKGDFSVKSIMQNKSKALVE